MSHTLQEFQYDPEKGYNRYSFYHQPPERPGFKLIHVRAHMRGKAHIREHWFYSRLDANGKQLRGIAAREKMQKMGLKQTSAPPEILTVKPDHIGQVQGLAPRGPKVPRRKGVRRIQKPIDTSATQTFRADEPIWVPVVGAPGDTVHGWVDFRTVRYVNKSDLTPEGLGGKVTSSAEIRITENFSEILESVKK